jgi:hypothetical protein
VHNGAANGNSASTAATSCGVVLFIFGSKLTVSNSMTPGQQHRHNGVTDIERRLGVGQRDPVRDRAVCACVCEQHRARRHARRVDPPSSSVATSAVSRCAACRKNFSATSVHVEPTPRFIDGSKEMQRASPTTCCTPRSTKPPREYNGRHACTQRAQHTCVSHRVGIDVLVVVDDLHDSVAEARQRPLQRAVVHQCESQEVAAAPAVHRNQRRVVVKRQRVEVNSTPLEQQHGLASQPERCPRARYDGQHRPGVIAALHKGDATSRQPRSHAYTADDATHQARQQVAVAASRHNGICI